MPWFLLESNRRFCAIFRRQAQTSCQETAGRLFIEGGVVLITNEESACGMFSRTEDGSGQETVNPEPMNFKVSKARPGTPFTFPGAKQAPEKLNRRGKKCQGTTSVVPQSS
jgi:hypothetical protein